jgi:hypothetical protein
MLILDRRSTVNKKYSPPCWMGGGEGEGDGPFLQTFKAPSPSPSHHNLGRGIVSVKVRFKGEAFL